MRKLALISIVLASWLALAAGAMLPGSIQTAAIIAPSAQLLSALPDHVAIIDVRPGLIVVRSDDPTYVRALYGAGARLIIPARQKTCLALQD